MSNYIKLLSFSVLALFALGSCGEQGLRSGDEVTTLEVDSNKTTIIGISGKLFSIPSPIQTAILIKNSDASYSESALHNPERANEYQSKSEQAINLGIYGTNMAYSSLYNDGQTALQHFKALDKLSNKLGISGAIDTKLVQRLGANAANADSLMLLSGQFYRSADTYLKENDRTDIAAYVILGGWVEASYLTSLAANQGMEASRQRLAEQKESVTTLLQVLENNGDPEFKAGANFAMLKKLRDIYADVKMTYHYAEPVTDKERKTTTIKSKTEYEMTDEQLTQITEVISSLRKNITG